MHWKYLIFFCCMTYVVHSVHFQLIFCTSFQKQSTFFCFVFMSEDPVSYCIWGKLWSLFYYEKTILLYKSTFLFVYAVSNWSRKLQSAKMWTIWKAGTFRCLLFLTLSHFIISVMSRLLFWVFLFSLLSTVSWLCCSAEGYRDKETIFHLWISELWTRMTKTVHLLSALSWDKGALCDAYQTGDVFFLPNNLSCNWHLTGASVNLESLCRPTLNSLLKPAV